MHACVRWWRRTVGLLRNQEKLNLAWLSLAFGVFEPGREMAFRLHNGGRNRGHRVGTASPRTQGKLGSHLLGINLLDEQRGEEDFLVRICEKRGSPAEMGRSGSLSSATVESAQDSQTAEGSRVMTTLPA